MPPPVVTTIADEGLLVGIGSDLVAWSLHLEHEQAVSERWTLSNRHGGAWKLRASTADLVWLQHQENGRTECYDPITGHRLLAVSLEPNSTPTISDGLLLARHNGRLVWIFNAVWNV